MIDKAEKLFEPSPLRSYSMNPIDRSFSISECALDVLIFWGDFILAPHTKLKQMRFCIAQNLNKNFII